LKKFNAMAAEQKILLVDDDQNFLDVYRETLRKLPGEPAVQTANTGARALAILEAEPFHLLIVDLNMPKMDGLQVLSVARRKFPNLPLVVWTGMTDEHFRLRAYALGVDQYWQKPSNPQDIESFRLSMDSLLNRQVNGGFRGVQSKSLVDLIQLECQSLSSSVIKISNGRLDARIWIHSGQLIDAEAQQLQGEEAFREVFSWKGGNFEILPPEPERPRAIFTSYQGLLLETLQALDESKAGEATATASAGSAEETANLTTMTSLAAMSRFEGVEFALACAPEKPSCSWGLERPEPMQQWLRQVRQGFSSLGEQLKVGDLRQLSCKDQRHFITITPTGDGELCVGFQNKLSADKIRETLKTILAKWGS
jgi:CheY-like chemotaxis protein